MLLIAQDLQVLPEVATGAGIEAGGRLVEQQDSRMKKALSQFDAALHASRERLDAFLGTIGKTNAGENLVHAVGECGSAKAVKMSLVPQILVGGKFGIDALRLEDDADLAPQTGWILRRIAAHHEGAAGGGNHQGGKNPKQRGLAAAVGTEQAEQFRRTHVERDAVERGAIFVAVNEILYGNDGGCGGVVRVGNGVS